MSIYDKIQNCRNSIREKKLTKLGHNNFSNYDYYLPEQVNDLVNDACAIESLFHKFELKRNEHGLFGLLTIIDLKNQDEKAMFEAATEMPTITATNASQQMGGCMTFAERYLKQDVFNIVDNSLDFDSKDNRQKDTDKKELQSNGNEEMKWLNKDMKEFKQAKEAIRQNIRTLSDVRKVFKVSKKVAALLEENKSVVDPDELIPRDDDLPFD